LRLERKALAIIAKVLNVKLVSPFAYSRRTHVEVRLPLDHRVLSSDRCEQMCYD